jgi:hypothetical protein
LHFIFAEIIFADLKFVETNFAEIIVCRNDVCRNEFAEIKGTPNIGDIENFWNAILAILAILGMS